MSEQNPNPPGAGNEPNNQPPANQPQNPAPAPTPAVQSFDAEYVRGLRNEAADYRTKFKAEEARAKGFETQIAELTQARQTDALRAEVAVQGGKLKIVDIDAALALMARDGVKFNEDGTIAGVEDALKKLIESKPYLVGKNTNPTPPANPARENTDTPVQPGMSRLAHAYSKSGQQ